MAEPEKSKDTVTDNPPKTEPAKTAGGKPSAAEIAKAIEGLTFRTNKGLPVMDDSTGKPKLEGGKPKLRYVPDLRPMRKDDVLSAAYDGQAIVLVAKDGSKHRIGK